MSDALLKPAEAAAYLGITLGTLYNWTSQRRVPVIKLSRGKRARIRFRRESLERMAERMERKAKL